MERKTQRIKRLTEEKEEYEKRVSALQQEIGRLNRALIETTKALNFYKAHYEKEESQRDWMDKKIPIDSLIIFRNQDDESLCYYKVSRNNYYIYDLLSNQRKYFKESFGQTIYDTFHHDYDMVHSFKKQCPEILLENKPELTVSEIWDYYTTYYLRLDPKKRIKEK